MDLTTISGTVSHCRVVTDTHGSISAKHGGSIRTSHATMFRVAGKPVEMEGSIGVENGDDVTVAGVRGAQTMKAIALSDNQTGVTFTTSADKRYLFAGIVLLAAGLSCGTMIAMEPATGALGLLVNMAIGGLLISRYNKERARIRAAEAMLAALPVQPAVA